MTPKRLKPAAARFVLATLILSGLAAMDAMPFSPALPPPLGRIDISVAGADPVQVYVEGELLSSETPAIVTVPSGEVTVTLRKAGYEELQETLTVEPLETVTLCTEMVRE